MRLEVTDGGAALAMRLDGQRVGYEIELSAAHDFLGSGVDKFVVGSALGEARGFRGCVANFTLNEELQGCNSITYKSFRHFREIYIFVDDCVVNFWPFTCKQCKEN